MAKVVVNFSGGKDSTVAILKTLECYPKEDVTLCFQDTGTEYLETLPHARKIAELFELPLVVLKRHEDFWQLAQRLKHFPSRRMRNCTLYLKIKEFNHWVRTHRDIFGPELVVVYGIRGEESLARRKMPEWSMHQTTLKNGKFIARQWLPCLDLKEQQIYDILGAEGIPLAPCYQIDKRCNCWCCFFMRPQVTCIYAKLHPELLEKACLVEDEIKHKWRADLGFNDLKC